MRTISEKKITELRRAWSVYVKDDTKGFDRLYKAIVAIWHTDTARAALHRKDGASKPVSETEALRERVGGSDIGRE